jgi:tetratricopeptide (TPR) repeat protein
MASHSSNLTSTGQFLGTPNYMAPEQIKGAPVDGRTDLFSFGIVLYEVLTEKKPFAGESLTSISYKIVHEPFPPARSVNPEIPRGFEPILSKCMAKEPSLRYQRGRDLAVDLRKLAVSLQVSDKPTLVGETPDASSTKVRDLDPRATIEVSKEDLEIDESSWGNEQEPVFDELPMDISDSARRLAGKAREEIARVVRGARPSQGFKTPVPVWIAALLLSLLVGWLVWWGISIRRETLEDPVEDLTLAAAVAEKKALAGEADLLFRRGDLEGALAKYRELEKLAPENRWVGTNIARIERDLRASALDRRKLAVARGKFETATRFYEEGDYEAAIPLFQEAFSADPNMPEDPGMMLRISSEKLALQEMIGRKVVIPPPDKSGLVVRFNSTVSDGYVAVAANRRTVLKENLWEERSGFVGRRVASPVHSYRNIDPGRTNLVVEVRVPAMSFRESRSFDVMLEESTLYSMTVSFDRMSRKLTVVLTSGGVPVKEIEDAPPAAPE